MRSNQELREFAHSCGVYLWQIASVLGMNDGNFSRKLRKELPEEEKARIKTIITELSQRAV